jgi:hypothetical protein
MGGRARGRTGRVGHFAAAAAAAVAPMGSVLAQGQPAEQPPVNVTAQPGTPPPVNVTQAPAASTAVALPEDGPSYPVGRFVISYVQDPTGLPLVEEIARTEVVLGRTESGYVAPREGVPLVRLRVADAADRGVEPYYASAIAAVSRAILDAYTRRGLIAVLVSPSEQDIRLDVDPNDPDWGRDLRPEGATDLRMVVRIGRVTELRTLAFGDRIPFEERINNPAHRRILENSPVQASSMAGGTRDLLRRDLLDEYLFRLNRHPGRRVDVAVAAAQEPGGVALDFLVSENRPWVIYAQVSNTGTEQTNEWRERIGFIHNQLTGNDDILSLDFITAGFEDTHVFVGSYEAPVFGSDRLRWRVFGQWNQFTASDVGIVNEEFEGDGFQVGGELIYNVFQAGELFVDLVGGARFQNVSVTNKIIDLTGETDFFLPYGGVRVERTTDLESSMAFVRLEGNLAGVAGTDDDELDSLGRLRTDDEWVTLQWDLSHSFYLEPLLNNEKWRTDPGSQTLAHELALSFRGQYAFDYRLVPNFEQVIGGLYSVRGYPESVVAGDTVLIGSIEYRWHIPRSLPVQPDPSRTPLFGQPFRWSPQQPYGRADWDLILRGFFDAGRAINSDRLSFEEDQTLLGIGVGLEFLFKRNLSVRADWGFALEEVEGEVDSGDNEIHFSATILF